MELEALDPMISNAQELTDLAKVSSKVDGIIKQINVMGYQMQAYIITTRVRETTNTGIDLLSVVNDQIKRISNEGFEKSDQIERWLIDAENKIDLAKRTLTDAEAKVLSVGDATTLATFRSELKRSRQYVKESNNLITQITSEIKTE